MFHKWNICVFNLKPSCGGKRERRQSVPFFQLQLDKKICRYRVSTVKQWPHADISSAWHLSLWRLWKRVFPGESERNQTLCETFSQCAVQTRTTTASRGYNHPALFENERNLCQWDIRMNHRNTHTFQPILAKGVSSRGWVTAYRLD